MDDNLLTISRESSSLRNQVVDSIRKAILSGQLLPGQKLVEKDLCVTLSISRTLLREALQHLLAEGLLDSSSYRSTSVAELTEKDAQDIYKVREVLEGLAGEGFAKHANAEHMEALRSTLNELARLDPSTNPDAVLKMKNRFYSILLDGCDNAIVGRMLVQLNNRITLLRRISLAQPGRFAQTLAELKEIISALESRNARKAKALCSAHVRRAAKAAEKEFSRIFNVSDQQKK